MTASGVARAGVRFSSCPTTRMARTRRAGWCACGPGPVAHAHPTELICDNVARLHVGVSQMLDSERCLFEWFKLLREEVRGACRSSEGRGTPPISSEDDRTVLHLLRPVRTPLEENEFDA